MNFRTIAALCAILLLSNCVTAALVTQGREADPISGHQVGIGQPDKIVDLADMRVRVSPVRAVRNHPIPQTYAFLFSWTPEAYNRRKAALGRRAPTQADWDRQVQRYIASTANDPNAANIAKSAHRTNAYARRQAERSAFRPYVAKDGTIARCNDTYGGKYGCRIGLSLDAARRKDLAAQALARVRPDCRIAQIDPPQVLALQPRSVKSGDLQLIAAVTCP